MPIHIKNLGWAAVAFAAALCGGTAHAATAASTAELTSLTFELIDLDPHDGITPYLTLNDERFRSTTAFNESGYYITVPDRVVDSSGITSLTRPWGAASTEWNGSYQFASASLDDNSGRSRIIAAENVYDVSFTLSPSTRLLVTANGVLTAHLSETAARAQTTTTLEGSVARDDWWEPYRFFFTYRSLESGTEAFSLQGTLENGLVPSVVSLSVDTLATASFYGQTTPVPEPATYAMLLAGVGLIGGVARRRRRG